MARRSRLSRSRSAAEAAHCFNNPYQHVLDEPANLTGTSKVGSDSGSETSKACTDEAASDPTSTDKERQDLHAQCVLHIRQQLLGFLFNV